MNKTCRRCKIEKPRTEFFRSGKHSSGKEKIRGDCKACTASDMAAWRTKNRAHYNSYMGEWRMKNPDKIRAMEIKRDYGLTMDQYQGMVESQNGVCKMCCKPARGKRPLVIDHDHKTGRIRGLLCYGCNRAIAILDNADHLQRALAYLAIPT